MIHLTADTWKVLGLLVGGAGTILAAVAKVFDDREKTRAARERESNSPPRKRSLYISIGALCIAVLGFVVGFLGEMGSQREALDAATKQAAETQHLLQGLASVFTRFETISVRLQARMPFGAPLAKYRHQLEKTITNLVDHRAQPGTVLNGVEVLTSVNRVPDVFSVGFSYAPGPIRSGRTTGDTYLRSAAPYVAVFKTPIDPKTFNSEHVAFGVLKPDLQLTPAPGAGKMILVRERYPENESDFLDGGDLHFDRIEMPRDSWFPSGNVMALKQLEGAQAIIYCPWFVCTYPELREVWDATMFGGIALIINDQRIDLNMRHLAATATSYGTVYSYVFPRLVPF